MREDLREHDVQLVSFPSSLSNYRITPCLIRCDTLSIVHLLCMASHRSSLVPSPSLCIYRVSQSCIIRSFILSSVRTIESEAKRYFFQVRFVFSLKYELSYFSHVIATTG